MSVITTADEKRDEAKEYIDKAYKCLMGVLDKDTWGHSDYNESYISDIEKITLELIKIKRKL